MNIRVKLVRDFDYQDFYKALEMEVYSIQQRNDENGFTLGEIIDIKFNVQSAYENTGNIYFALIIYRLNE